MQAPSRNRCGNRGGSVTAKQLAARFAPPLVRQRNAGLLTHAIVAAGLAVAAADYELRSR